ncbi:MAG: hypothetical protein ACRDYA_17570 [Egibacteraceae bacterium]
MAQLEYEVKSTAAVNPNYEKAAKRLCNVFRLNGRYEEAAFLRELFDEPVALLYQVHALVRTVEEATSKSRVFSIDSILNQTDDLIIDVIKVLAGLRPGPTRRVVSGGSLSRLGRRLRSSLGCGSVAGPALNRLGG